VPAIQHAIYAAAHEARATPLNGYFHQFSPTGVSGLLCLAESHLSIHTWPEHAYAALDILHLRRRNGARTRPFRILIAALEAKDVKIREIERGTLRAKPSPAAKFPLQPIGPRETFCNV